MSSSALKQPPGVKQRRPGIIPAGDQIAQDHARDAARGHAPAAESGGNVDISRESGMRPMQGIRSGVCWSCVNQW